MNNYTTYRLSTGQILRVGTTPFELEDVLSEDLHAEEGILEGHFDPLTQYFDIQAGTMRSRPAMGASIDKTSITSDGVDEATISAVPEDARAWIDGPEGQEFVTVTGGTLAISSDVAGTITVRLRFFPRLDQVFSIEAVAP